MSENIENNDVVPELLEEVATPVAELEEIVPEVAPEVTVDDVKPLDNVVASELPVESTEPAEPSVDSTDGIVKSAVKTPKVKPAAKTSGKPVADKVALYSSKNLHWSGGGALLKGYNIVSEKLAEKYLQHRDVRKATPEEVAQEFGK